MPNNNHRLGRQNSTTTLNTIGDEMQSMPQVFAANFNSLQEVIDFNTRLSKSHPWMIDPRSTKWIAYWDFCTSVSALHCFAQECSPATSSRTGALSCLQVALIYTATFTPYEVALIEGTDWGFFTVNRITDFLFLCDMILQVGGPRSARRGGDTE
jgi:hypothetical protein